MFGLTLVDIFGNISVFLLFAWFCSSLLENRWPIASTIIGISLYGVALPILCESPAYVNSVPAVIRYAIVMLCFWSYTMVCFKGGLKEKIIIYCLGYTMINVSQVVVTNLMNAFHISIPENLEWLLAVSAAMTFAMMYMVSRIWQSISLVLHQKRFLAFFLVPVCQFALVYLFVYLTTKSSNVSFLMKDEYRWIMLAVGAVFMISIIADGMVIENVAKMADVIKAQEQLKTLELENQLTYDYIKAMESDIQEMRRYRHDFLNMLTAVQLTIENGGGDNTGALALVRQMTSEIGSVTGKRYCECNIINCILALEEKKLTEVGIKSDIRAEVPEDLRVNELDLCRVMTNIFDNAREACLREQEDKRFVSANARVVEGYLYVTVRNSHSGGEIRAETSKKDKKLHGHGVDILRQVTARNDGELLISYEPDAITVTATFRCREQ